MTASVGLKPPRLRGTIVKTGPFFEHNPGDTFRDNAARMMESFGAEGEADVEARIASIPPAGVRTGARRRKITGRAHAIGGQRWGRTAVIGIPRSAAGDSAKAAIRTYAALATIERAYHPIRGTANALRGARSVNAAELTKGLE